MNGIFKLGLVGEQKSLLGALQSSREYLGKEAFESGARTEGVQPFGKTNKLVLESSGACAMGDAEELFSHLCRRFPELEGILLLHNTDCYTDYGDDDVWMVSYSRAGEETSAIGAGMLGRKEPGLPGDWGEFVEYGDRDALDVDDVLRYLNQGECRFTRESVEYYIARAFGEAEGGPPEDLCEEDDLDFELDEYIAERAYSAFHRYIGTHTGLPPIQYLAELFAGGRGLSFPD